MSHSTEYSPVFTTKRVVLGFGVLVTLGTVADFVHFTSQATQETLDRYHTLPERLDVSSAQTLWNNSANSSLDLAVDGKIYSISSDIDLNAAKNARTTINQYKEISDFRNQRWQADSISRADPMVMGLAFGTGLMSILGSSMWAEMIDNIKRPMVRSFQKHLVRNNPL